jgi:RNA polymerase sigma-70 factor, ECF subfamily
MPELRSIFTLAEALAGLADRRDPACWEFLLQEAGPKIEVVVCRIAGDPALAQDALQETMLQIRDHAGNFTVQRDDPSGSALRWILRVAANTAIKLMRSRTRSHHLHRRAADEPSEPPMTAADILEQREHAGLVRRALGELSEIPRTAVVLHHVAGLSFPEIASELRCPLGTAKSHVRRGLERMRMHLQRAGVIMSITALAGALQGLPAATVPNALQAASTLLTSPLQAAPLWSIQIGGMVMATKIGIAAAGILFAAITPFIFTQEADWSVVPDPPRVDETKTDNPEPHDILGRNEKDVLRVLEGIALAQHKFKTLGYKNMDGDDIGEYGLFAEWPDQSDKWLKHLRRYGYQFRVYLPSDSGAISDVEAQGKPIIEPQHVIDDQERYFFAYAWPENENSGRFCFMLSFDGKMRWHRYEGKPMAWNAALKEGAKWSDTPVWPAMTDKPNIEQHGFEMREILDEYPNDSYPSEKPGDPKSAVVRDAQGAYAFADGIHHDRGDALLPKRPQNPGDEPSRFYRLGEPRLTGKDIAEVSRIRHDGKWAMSLSFTKQGAVREAFTVSVMERGPREGGSGTGRIAIVIDRQVVSDPIIVAPSGSKAVISGDFDEKELDELRGSSLVLGPE